MSMFGILGFLSLICALLVIKDKKKYKSLVKAAGLKDNAKFASTYYSIAGLLLVIGSFVSDSYISGFIVPFLFFAFSALLSGIIIIKKSNNRETTS